VDVTSDADETAAWPAAGTLLCSGCAEAAAPTTSRRARPRLIMRRVISIAWSGLSGRRARR